MASQKDRQNFMHYIHQSKTVSCGAHPNIVNMVGCVTLHEPVCLAFHYPAGGTLLAYLERSRKEVHDPTCNPNTLIPRDNQGVRAN